MVRLEELLHLVWIVELLKLRLDIWLHADCCEKDDLIFWAALVEIFLDDSDKSEFLEHLEEAKLRLCICEIFVEVKEYDLANPLHDGVLVAIVEILVRLNEGLDLIVDSDDELLLAVVRKLEKLTGWVGHLVEGQSSEG